MGAFEYVALDAAGHERKGILEGDTPRHIRQLLREQQLLPVSVGEVAQREAKRQRSFSFMRRVSSTDLALFTRQLATLVRAGLPLEESLLAVSQQTERPRVQSIVLGVRAKVMEGHTLASGFSEFPRVFPEIYRATVAAGEQAGHLDNVLERLAEYTESREQIRQKVLAALLYPIVLTVLCFAIVSFLLVFVVPKVVSVFESTKAKLPLITRALIGTSDFFRLYGIYVLIAAALGVWLFQRWQKNPAGKRAFHTWQLRVPVLGKLRARLQYRALHPHLQHPLGQLRAGAGSDAHRRGRGHEPADARCGRPMPPRGCARAPPSGAPWRSAACSRP